MNIFSLIKYGVIIFVIVCIYYGKKELLLNVITAYFRTIFLQCFDYKGRTTRRWFYSCTILNLFMLIRLSSGLINKHNINSLDALGLIKIAIIILVLLSTFSLFTRRLHDINLSGWLFLGALIFPPALAIISLLCLMNGTDGENKYGADPRNNGKYGYLQ